MTTVLLIGTDANVSVLCMSIGAGEDLFAYCAYGHNNNPVWKRSRLGFNGQPIDAITGVYMLGNGYRAYNPIQMRFHSPDAMSPFGKGGLNAYAYCSGDPVNASDPDGHSLLRRSKSLPSLRPRPQPRRNSMPDLQGQLSGLEKVSHLPLMDNILSHLDGADFLNLYQTSKKLAQAVNYRSLKKAQTLFGSSELLAAAEGQRPGVLPRDALARGKELHPLYRGDSKELMRLWKNSSLADTYKETAGSAFIGPRGMLGIRRGNQMTYLSPH